MAATASGLPVLHADALAWAECVTVHEIEPGDHVILLGQVEEGAGAADDDAPLMYYRRSWGVWKPAPRDAGAGRSRRSRSAGRICCGGRPQSSVLRTSFGALTPSKHARAITRLSDSSTRGCHMKAKVFLVTVVALLGIATAASAARL